MNKFIRKLLYFICFSLVGYVFFVIIFGLLAPDFLKFNLNYRIGSNGHLYSRIQEVRQVENTDILFLGSSHAYRGFDPRIFKQHGYSSFNLGSSAQTPIQTHILLKRYLDTISPKIIIYEVNPSIFESDGVESSLDLLANDKNDVHILRMAFNVNHLKTYNTMIYSIFRKTFKLDKHFKEDEKKELDTYISGGYVEKEVHSFVPEAPFEVKQNFLPKTYQIEAFEALIEMINIRQIKLVIVQAPITDILYSSYKNQHLFNEYILEFAPYYNFNDLSQLNDTTHFYDAHHLNQLGVNIFNEALIDTLEAHQHLPSE